MPTTLRLRILYTDSSSSSASPTSTAASNNLLPRSLVVDVPASWRVGELKRHLSSSSSSIVASLFRQGHALLDTDELILLHWQRQQQQQQPVVLLTLTTADHAFRVCEAGTLVQFADRAEAYRLHPVLKALREVNAHFAAHPHARARPATADSGSGGMYFIKNAKSRQVLACFKPRQEELGTQNNPAPPGTTLRQGVLPGHGAEREAAAFALDHAGFAGVPPTLLVEASGHCFGNSEGEEENKVGSFQYFQPNAEENVGDYSAHLFSTHDVHKVALLDIRYLNLDRNDSNLLVINHQSNSSAATRPRLSLVPIDHGLCFPDRIEVAWCDWVWWDWPQTLEPFDAETRQWVASLDVHADMAVLQSTFAISRQALRIFYCMTRLLQTAVGPRYGLNLRDVASVVVRQRELDSPSAMEKTVERAAQLADLMAGNARVPAEDDEDDALIRSSSFDGLASAAATVLPPKKSKPAVIRMPPPQQLRRSSVSQAAANDKLFFSYVDRLVDDICHEIVLKKREQPPLSPPSSDVSLSSWGEEATAWFDVSQRISPSELTKMPSPRLLPMKHAAAPKKPASPSSPMVMSFADFSLE